MQVDQGSGAPRPIANVDIIETNFSFKTMNRFKKTPDALVVHHSGVTTLQGPEIIHHYHLVTKGWSGAGYHFYVRKDGKIYALRPTEYVGVHAPGYNSRSLGICFEGNFNTETMSSAQLTSGKKLVALLMTKYSIKSSNIIKHNQASSTDCPGSKFPMSNLVNGAIEIVGKYSILSTGLSTAKSSSSTDDQNSVTASYTSSAHGIYIVQKGDTLSGIANKLGVSLQTLISINSSTIPNPNKIYPGQEVVYPTNSTSTFNEIADSSSMIANASLEAGFGYMIATVADEEAKKQYEAVMQNINSQRSIQLNSDGNKILQWESQDIVLPGYSPCMLQIELATGEKKSIPFLISPSGSSDTRQSMVQANKTNAGWFIYRLGQNLGQVSFNGFMLDTKNEMERHAFLQEYKHYVVDKQMDNHDYINENIVSLFLEGIQYIGYITGLTFTKSSVQQFLYQYSMQFMFVEDRAIYDSVQNIAIASANSSGNNTSSQTYTLSEEVSSLLTESSVRGE